jgi:hypothetical protein
LFGADDKPAKEGLYAMASSKQSMLQGTVTFLFSQIEEAAIDSYLVIRWTYTGR